MSAIDGPSLSYWKSTSEAARDRARKILSEIVESGADEFVELFYRSFLAHKEAANFLSHSVVHARLAKSLRSWVIELVATDPFSDTRTFDAHQTSIGEIHARLQIPNHLVLEGAGLLKTSIARQLFSLDLPGQETASSILLLSELVDYAMRLMSEAYVSDTKRQAHVDQAFRMFTLGQDLGLERERQRAAVMQWSQDVLFGIISGKADVALTPLATSPFGLWIRHRGTLLFQGSTQLATIEDTIAHIDATFLPHIRSSDADKAALLGALQTDINKIQFLLNDLFQMATTMENGRDPLTRAFNRRFLPSVLGREISMAQASGTPLSVMMLDVDHFKEINDRYGHASGDIVLGQIAELLMTSVRNSDFVFRYGGEEFLIVLIESDIAEAQRVAEILRARFEQLAIALPDKSIVKATVSIGIAGYDGHPDYEFLINAADKALYAAKHRGRNQVALADALAPA